MASKATAIVFSMLAALPALAQPAVPPRALLSVSVADETAPPGGVAQIQFDITEPKPIITGDAAFAFDPALELLGISLFSLAGDATGAVVVENRNLRIRINSPSGSVGMNADYPFLVMAFAVPQKAVPGTTMALDFSAGTLFTDPTGAPYPAEFKPGLLTIGGTMSIGNVRPGGGLVNAGDTIFIDGVGFEPDAKVSINGFVLDTVDVLSPKLIRVVTATAGKMDGARVRVKNPDGELDEYYSYDRIKQQFAASANALLAATVPLFADATCTEAVFNSGAPGLAVENPSNTAPAAVLLETYAGGVLTGSADWMMPPHSKVVRDINELIPNAGAFDSVRVVSSAPIRALMLNPDYGLGVVDPVSAASVR